MDNQPIIIRCVYGKGQINIPANADETILLALKKEAADIQGVCVGDENPNIYMCTCKINQFLNGEFPKKRSVEK